MREPLDWPSLQSKGLAPSLLTSWVSTTPLRESLSDIAENYFSISSAKFPSILASKSSSQEGSMPTGKRWEQQFLFTVAVEINSWYNSVRCSNRRKASQHLKGTVNNPMKISAQYKINLPCHFEMGVQGKHNSPKGTATTIIRICFHK